MSLEGELTRLRALEAEDVDLLFHEIDGEPGSYRCAYCEAKARQE